MKLLLKTIHFDPDYTIGELYVDGVKACVTLEDTVRERLGVPVAHWKVQDRTAIPSGVYAVRITPSARFGRALPLLDGVPGFAGVRIHPGNSSANTEGCILIGQHWRGGDWITDSRAAFGPLFDRMEAAHRRGDPIEIEITR